MPVSLDPLQPQSASAVLDDIHRTGGAATPRDLRRRLGWTERTLYRRLAELVDSGQVVRHGHGQYAVASAGSLPLPDTGREIVGVLAEADVAAFTRHDRTFAPRIGADEANARHETWRAQVYR